jgi:putative methyltransferase (TIGR04325 family)
MSSPVITWDGVFNTFDEAGVSSTAFDSPLWIEKVLTRAQALLDRSNGALPEVTQTNDYALPFIAAACSTSDRALRILDFGGGMATSYIPLRAMLPPAQRIEYIVVENAELVGAGRKLFAEHPEVRFEVSLPAPEQSFDIVHFGSSLHYVDKWLELLTQCARFRPQFLLFADLTAGNVASFVTHQLWHGRRIPVRFWNCDEFVGSVCKLGFDLVFKARFQQPGRTPESQLPMLNFDDRHRLPHTSQLAFRRT